MSSEETRKNDILFDHWNDRAAMVSAHADVGLTSDHYWYPGLHLTLVSFIIVGRTGGPLRNYWILAACFGYILNWFGDSLDGTLARYRHVERPNYGYFVDHSVDGFTALCMFLGFGYAGIARIDVVEFAAIGYLLMMITVFLKTKVTGVFEMTTIKLGPTEIRVIAIIFSLVHFFIGIKNVNVPLFGSQTYGTIVVGLIAALLFVYYLVETVRVSIKLERVDASGLPSARIKKPKSALKLKKNWKKARRHKLEETGAEIQNWTD